MRPRQGANGRFDAHLARVEKTLASVRRAGDPQFLARRVAEELAVGFSASLLVRHAPVAVADA